MTDLELRGLLLSHFYGLRHSNGGYVPVTSIILSPEPVSDDVIAGVCRQLADVGLIDWTAYLQGPTIGSARITGSGVDAVERGSSPSIEIRFPSKNASAPSSPPPTNDAPVPPVAIDAIRSALSEIKVQLPTLNLSNSAKADISADVSQIEIEADRPSPRRKFLKTFLESLRDNLAKAMATGLVATVAGLIAKYFHVF